MTKSRTKAKLLFLTPTADISAGGEVSNLELMRDAQRRGYRVTAIVARKGPLTRRLKEMGIEHRIVDYTLWNDAWSHIAAPSINQTAVSALYTIIRDEKIDCVTTNTLNMPWGAVAAALADVPHLWIAREFPLFGFTFLVDRYDFIKAYSNLVMANSEALANYMKSQQGFSEIGAFRSYVDSSTIVIGNRSGEPRLVCIGAIHPNKNQLELLQAAAILAKLGYRPDILLIGSYNTEDPYYQSLTAYIKRHKLGDQVAFLGYKKTPYRSIGHNDIIIQPSLSESIGRVVVEAMKLGLVTVGADIPGTSEVIGLAGTSYRSQDPEDLADKLRTILADLPSAQQRAHANQAKVMESLSLEACHDPFFARLKTIIGQPNPQRHQRHLTTHVLGMSKALDQKEDTIKQYQRSVDQHRHHLNGILESKSWKTLLALRKVLGRTGQD